jgi:hemerythrin-like domain-containing protein
MRSRTITKTMKPIGPLMIEHRLIERVIALLRREYENIQETKRADTALVERFVDFLRTYADRCHHGKEEDILFRDLDGKKLDPEFKQILKELKADHVRARKLVGQIACCNEGLKKGDTRCLGEMTESLEELVELYPEHIRKEDKQFFLPAMEYFDQEEQDRMLRECFEFDRQLIHEKYKAVVDELEKQV